MTVSYNTEHCWKQQNETWMESFIRDWVSYLGVLIIILEDGTQKLAF